MKKVLIGMVDNGSAGGVDRYILNFYHSVKDDTVQIDFLTNLEDNPFLDKLDSPGAHLFHVSNLYHPIRQYREVKRILQDGYDVLYMNISTALTIPCFLAAKQSGVKKIIAHSHSAGYDCAGALKRKLMTLLHRLCKGPLSRCVTDFLSCSDKASEWMFPKKVLQNPGVQIIQNTADTSVFSYDEQKRNDLREKLGLKDRFVIGFVGNLVYQKNPLFLPEIMREVVKRDREAMLVVIGDGPFQSALRQKIAGYNLEDHIRLLGRVDASDGYMSAFDVFVLPSEFEGMPIVSVEAQCSKLPCVFSDHITQMAKISNFCEFLPIDDAAGWAENILKYKTVDRQDHMILSSLERFSLQAQADTLAQVIGKGQEQTL